MKMSVSQVLREDGKKKIYVEFTEAGSVQNKKGPSDSFTLTPPRLAEGIYPDCKITKSEGFSEEEIAALELYMKTNGDQIKELASTVSLWKAFAGEPSKNK